MSSLSFKIASVASLMSRVFAQTPDDFKPGTLVKLGVTFPGINIDPTGSSLQSLDQAQVEPSVTVPTANLLAANGQPIPGQRFMVLMIDTDVVQQNVATTVLHWFQPDLIMDVSPAPAAILPQAQPTPKGGNSTVPAAAAAGFTKLVKLGKQNSITGIDLPPTAVGQVDYLPPGPPPGPPHRYVQVLFAQPANFTVPACFKNIVSQPGNPSANGQARLGFDINQFLAASGVRTRPIAGNYFRAQNAQPGSLTQNAVATRLVNANCPGVTPTVGKKSKRFLA